MVSGVQAGTTRKELESYKQFPPLQAPETYNLTGILDAMKKAGYPSD